MLHFQVEWSISTCQNGAGKELYPKFHAVLILPKIISEAPVKTSSILKFYNLIGIMQYQWPYTQKKDDLSWRKMQTASE